ncbi:hypothetical protein ACQY0O_005387 [Thecaphora frezii]
MSLASSRLAPSFPPSLATARLLAVRHASTSSSGSPNQSIARPAPLSSFTPTPASLNKHRTDHHSQRPAPSGGRTRAGGAAPKPTPQRWSNATLILLSTAVGASTFTIGMAQGYKAGRKSALEPSSDASSSSPTSPALSTSSLLPATPPTPSRAVTIPTLSPSPGSTSAWSLPLWPLSSLLPTVHCDDSQPPPPTAKTTSRPKCQLKELVQFHCRLRPDRVVCHPVDRFFRICANRPAVEVTHLVEFDKDGNPFLPDEFEEAMPPSQHWHGLMAHDL